MRVATMKEEHYLGTVATHKRVFLNSRLKGLRMKPQRGLQFCRQFKPTAIRATFCLFEKSLKFLSLSF